MQPLNNNARASPNYAVLELDLAALANLATLEEVPEAIPLHPLGKFKGNNKDFYFDDESLERISKEKSNGADWPLDLEHDAFYQDYPEANPLNFGLEPKDFVLIEDVRMGGWITEVLVKDNYVYGSVQWLAETAQEVLEGEHRYVSAVLIFDDAGHIIGYHSFGLVKRPGTTNQRRIGLKNNPKTQTLSLTVSDIGDEARKRLQAKYRNYIWIADILNDSIVFVVESDGLYQVSYTVEGTKLILGDDITKVVRSYTPKEEEAMNKAQLAALAAKLNMPFETEDDEKKLLEYIEQSAQFQAQVLSATGAASADAAIGAIAGLRQTASQTQTYAEQLAAAKKEKEDTERKTLIEKLSSEGKLAPAQMEWAQAMPLEQLRSFASVAMPLVNLGAKEKEPAMQRDAVMSLREALNSKGPGKQKRIMTVYHEILSAYAKGELNLEALAGPAAGGAALLSEPAIWSARTLEQLDKEFVYVRAFTNRDYEADARIGGTVNMFYFNSVGVTNYTGGWTDGDWTSLGDNQVVLQIDQAKKVLFKIPRIRQQFNPISLLEQGTERAAQDIGDVVDQFVAASHADVAAGNAFGTTAVPIVVGFGAGQTKPTLALARLNQALVAARAPRMGTKRVVVPDWFGTMLLTELGNRATLLGDATVQNGELAQGLIFGNVSGFAEVHVSANVPNTAGAKYKVLAGGQAIAMAMGIEEQQIVPLQNDFGDGFKALYVYGKKLPRAEYMSVGTFDIGAYQ